MHVTRSYTAAGRLAHLGGLMAFTAAFAGLYVLCASIAFGFNIVQALIIDLTVFGSGMVLWAAPRAGKVVARWRSISAHHEAGRSLTFARKSVSTQSCSASKAKARPLARPGPESLRVPFGAVLPAG